MALARALIGQPQVLLLDEPLAALDLKLRKAMQLELRRIQEELGTSFLYVTHDQEEALTMSDRIVLMNEGRIVQEGSPAEIYDRPATVFASGFIGEANLLRGTVAAVDGERARVRVLDTFGGDRSGAGHGPDLPVVISVRPERLRVGRPGAANGADNRALGTLQRRIFLGNIVRQFVVLGPDLVVAAQTDVDDEPLQRATRSKSPGGPTLRFCCRRWTRDRRRRTYGVPQRATERRGRGSVRESERPRAWMVQLLPATMFLLVFLVGPVAVFFRLFLLDRRWLRPGAGLES